MDNTDETQMEIMNNSKPVMLFGRDLREIPCFKHSMLYGIYAGIGVGLVGFMLTSRPKLATEIGLGSYMTVAMVYWNYCRYNNVRQKYALAELQMILKQKHQVETYKTEQEEKLVDA